MIEAKEGESGLPEPSIMALKLSMLRNVCACTTCHVVIREGFGALSLPDELEDDLLGQPGGLSLNSRLSCQAMQNETPLVVEIPRHSINMTREGKRSS